MAAHGLQENTGLLGFVVAAKVAMVGVVLPLGALLTLSYTNGNLAPNREHAAVHRPPWLCVSCGAPELAARPFLDEGGTLTPVTSWAPHICSPALHVTVTTPCSTSPLKGQRLGCCLTTCSGFGSGRLSNFLHLRPALKWCLVSRDVIDACCAGTAVGPQQTPPIPSQPVTDLSLPAPSAERNFSKHTTCVDDQGSAVPCCTWQLDVSALCITALPR